MRLNFSFQGSPVGYFVDLDTYPSVPGRYKYMPFRGPGHLALRNECTRNGCAHCTYPVGDGVVSFVVRCEEAHA